MVYASLCHTDFTCLKGTTLFPMITWILGHEGAGVIESVGEEVKDLKVGDNVMIFYVGECGECANCTSEKTNLCSRFPQIICDDMTSRIYAKGQRMYRMFSSSTWVEYAVVELWWSVERVPSVAVLGLGAVGLGVVKASKILGASKIFGIDVNDMKRDIAIAFGVTDFGVRETHSDIPKIVEKCINKYKFCLNTKSSSLIEAKGSGSPPPDRRKPTHKLLLKQWLKEEELILNRLSFKETQIDATRKEISHLYCLFFLFHSTALLVPFSSAAPPDSPPSAPCSSPSVSFGPSGTRPTLNPISKKK
ncbi:hypothetical protein SASPL_103599 [Salvia splendens]|uniref:Alcohol dehydrogenase-like N-terminal domain-containing protein n=1 Tax=Salvia splendens TaxID=180675 RepID=A0A8X9A913_SALSN|nr:hypothetical protein SASPL_103599 [Salvia splendens]